MQLCLFDIDGTLTATSDIDTACFVQALKDVFGLQEVNTDWSIYPDVTDSAVTTRLVEMQRGQAPTESEMRQIREHFYALLQTAFEHSPEQCLPIAGGPRFLNSLARDPQIAIAFATGGWEQTARLKLELSGYDHGHYPLASANDAFTRTAICSLAVERAQQQYAVTDFETIIAFGDGIWDARAAVELGYRFVGIAQGEKTNLLQTAGAELILPNYEALTPAQLRERFGL
ncbi:MAG: haloacid dehalogenase-like hydrolase [Planctomycetaceae bacterium]|nr:haloacid dehalogenase-like hydrolase [Planctomycetaceae bacterium]